MRKFGIALAGVSQGGSCKVTYLAAFPPEVQAILEKIRSTVSRAAPGAQEAISYGIPAFTLNGVLVYFASFKNTSGSIHLYHHVSD
jgi:uncharacterized protein YdhG (YjbR/CyaY superfamily)